jgi:transcriptional regulator with XRE-family HTH domain
MLVDEKRLYHLIVEQLKRKRREDLISQAELGAQAGLQHSSIANIEAGKQRVSLHSLYDLCNALDLEPREILPTIAEVMEPEVRGPVTIFGKTLIVTEKTAKAMLKVARKSIGKTTKKSGADK